VGVRLVEQFHVVVGGTEHRKKFSHDHNDKDDHGNVDKNKQTKK
jgi:hypothetical protein